MVAENQMAGQTEQQEHQEQQQHPSPASSQDRSKLGSNNQSQSTPSSSTVPNAGIASFRRQRASRACEVRCDAASLGVPCTNCVAFAIECRIPTPKRKKNQQPRNKDNNGDTKNHDQSKDDDDDEDPNTPRTHENPVFSANPPISIDGMPANTLATASQPNPEKHNPGHYSAQIMKPKFTRAPIKEPGRVAYLGESSNLSLLVHDRGHTDVVHYPLPETIRGSRGHLTELDSLEIEILHRRGAFLLPPRDLCDELVEAYFKWVAPVVPIVNRNRFMRRYRDPQNPPSLLLLQAILLAGSRVCNNSKLMDQNGSTIPASTTFYKRAKALYDANYEDDRVTLVQALVLMGWYWEGPEDVTKNVFYWSRVAILVAQGSGMHRSVENSQLSRSDKRLWKRIWWTLFTRDRSVAVALGRPININIDDSDVEMLTEDDFIEDEDDIPAEYPPDPIHVQFFLQYVKLCEIMGLVLSQQYSVASKSRRTNAIDLTHSDMALADWLQNCPRAVYWERKNHHFWAALLHSNYYTTLCLLHRAHMPPATASANSYRTEEIAYPSRTIAFQAAGMITSIVEKLQSHNEIRYTPAFIVYSLFSALIMHVYQMRSSVPSVVAACQERMTICMQALKDVSKVWLVAKMVHTLFESILGNKVLEERLQKAPGKRHQKNRPSEHEQNIASNHKKTELPKRKFDDMDLGLPNGNPTPPVSYERSRPQTPAATPSRELNSMTGQQGGMGSLPQMSPNLLKGQDGAQNTGMSRAQTPFNPSYSLPATPPDLFLVTRTSPNLSPTLWENFQPDQLFPDGTNFFPTPANMMDPQMQSTTNTMGGQGNMMMNHHQQQQQQQMPSRTLPGAQGSPSLVSSGGIHPDMGNLPPQPSQQMFGMEGMQNWAGLDAALAGNPDSTSQDDNWSTSSRGNPTAPTTLNVEDWFQFFGINGGFGDLITDPMTG
ncbi:C6 transcription factor Ctf1A, putative [Talaromyces stipitatus ATCC 10500]|uniref:C6 transcription factor Ctf1A, putative n=1 Tax=Talaromyces stipitatus (strain ATCC 10500 / CBS 375.48 / QM 6759 / NRRL 1006) TaxID=441959 RepID=B8MDQ6_TALSN|nr:C6 transcription factor Ctf1A, putative [Talaromyces stipitatus ATCC 10500]EED18285.1 C6 transcription factor Ctf1A, putative [Talaromyces stipitatus ATCC 10500]